MSNWTTLAAIQLVTKTAEALKANGFETFITANAEEAKNKALELIPRGAEVFTASSVTVDQIGLTKELTESGHFDAVKNKLISMDQKTQGREMRKLGSGPDYSVGSAHAVTESGSIVVASLSGSQLPGYSFGAGTVVLIVSTKKIVKDLDAAYKRIHEHIVPLESVRVRKAYGLPDSFNTFPGKVLIFNREVNPSRLKVILVEQDLGY